MTPRTGLIVLVGAAGAGKSTWAARQHATHEIVSSDALRAVVGTGPADLDASRDAFAVLDSIVAARLRRGLTAVVDTLGLDADRRLAHLALARAAGVPAVVVVVTTPADECRSRNAARDRPVPLAVLRAQLARVPAVLDAVRLEGWDDVVRVDGSTAGTAAHADVLTHAAADADGGPVGSAGPGRALRFVLQVSRFPWDAEGPLPWLTAVATEAERIGVDGIALMDHLIQIPQVGRAWEPIPEPWVTLGALAAVTTRVQLGTLVSPVSLHAPGRLAKAAATLDVLSGGRAFLGLGAGWFAREHLGFGLPFAPPAERVSALAAAVPTVRALWAPGTKPAPGLPETTCYPRPVGPLPILVGGRGARVLAIAAEHADGCNVPADEAGVRRAATIMRGKRVTVLDVPVIGRDRDDVARLVERLRGRTSAAAFARRHSAGLASDHVARYRALAALGVDTVFLALPQLRGPADLAVLGPVLAAFDRTA